MKICVVGAGSIGGLLAAKLAHAGQDVSVVARRAHLDAIRKHGLKLIEEGGEEIVANVKASDDMADLGLQDCVILGMKAQQVAAVVDDLPKLIGEKTTILTAQNGIPWWYFHKIGGEYEGRRLESVDPGGVVADALPIDRIIGSVVYPAAEITAPGVIKHIEGNRFSLAEVDNATTERVTELSKALTEAGFKAPVVSDIRAEIWMKLWGNSSLNPISALTHATLEDICRYPLTRDLTAAMMAEAQKVGEALGVRFRISIDKRIAGAEAIGKHKTSMLQDIEAGRGIEADALLGSVLEIAQMTGVPTPNLQAVFALVKLTAKMIQDNKGKLRIEPV